MYDYDDDLEWLSDMDDMDDNWGGFEGGRFEINRGWKKQYNEIQDKKDKEVVSILTDLTQELSDLQALSEEDVAKIFDLIENSALLPYIESKLESCNFLEIERHADVYR